MYETHFLSDGEKFEDRLQDVIRKTVSYVYGKINKMLSIDECSVIFIAKKNTDTGDVFRVFGADSDDFYISIDRVAASKLLNSNEEIFMKGLLEYLYAGLYETARAQNLEEEIKHSLFEEVIEAGLVAHFIEEMTGKMQQHLHDISDSKLKEIKEKLKKECSKGEDCDISVWFSGSKFGDIPPNSASLIGYHIVDSYLSCGGIKSTDVLSVPASKFILK